MAEQTKKTEVKEEDVWAQKKTVICMKRFPKDKYRDVMAAGRWIRVKTGVPVEVSLPFAEVIESSNRQREEYEKMISELASQQQELKY